MILLLQPIFRCGMCLTSARNSSDKTEIFGFFKPAAVKTSITSFDDAAFIIISIAVACPIRPEFRNRIIKLNANAAAHADDHRFAVHHFGPSFIVFEQIFGNDVYAMRAEAEASIIEYIEMFYNSERLYQALGYVTPNEFESSCFDIEIRLTSAGK